MSCLTGHLCGTEQSLLTLLPGGLAPGPVGADPQPLQGLGSLLSQLGESETRSPSLGAQCVCAGGTLSLQPLAGGQHPAHYRNSWQGGGCLKHCTGGRPSVTPAPWARPSAALGEGGEKDFQREEHVDKR